MKPHQNWLNLAAMAAVIVGLSAIVIKNLPGKVALLLVNVSYDPTRELYQAFNPVFATSYEKETGRHVVITQSHGGSFPPTSSRSVYIPPSTHHESAV